ncbi:DUF485 domain-containing protein [Lipingzhangella sp. LS1_29]|uniref:DUF485 domain-containing protein n=1 Tax=Lipingzhangella rawalii TaxID=2055835 RepID=A0ABU2H9U5_9ACTN|nr:DUF485 domain-containing protein [Lipingzhangella rawalii]MDS1271629.1 DUF485 domain-containing protein [Lipingzhangella rawalii]
MGTAAVAMHADPRFRALRRRLTVFIFPMSIAFMAWYLLYVIMSGYARDLMSVVLFGSVNLALLFGLLQFISTFGIALVYSRYAARRLDPLSTELRVELENGDAAGAGVASADNRDAEPTTMREAGA